MVAGDRLSFSFERPIVASFDPFLMSKNAILLFVTILAGLVCNQGGVFAYLIPYLLMLMLFFPFLTVSRPKDATVYRHGAILFAVMGGIGVIAYVLLLNWNRQLAVVAFLLGFSPTATAAPVVIGLLRKNVDYVVTAVVMTNVLVALVLPFVLSVILPQSRDIIVTGMLSSTLLVVFIPLSMAQLIKIFSVRLAAYLIRFRQIPFAIWLIVLYLASAKASSYVFANMVSFRLIIAIAALSLLLCLTNFRVGHYVGGAQFAREGSQALGQKNTLFMTWVALEYVSPIAALGPVFYLIFQNLYNSLLLSREIRRGGSSGDR